MAVAFLGLRPKSRVVQSKGQSAPAVTSATVVFDHVVVVLVGFERHDAEVDVVGVQILGKDAGVTGDAHHLLPRTALGLASDRLGRTHDTGDWTHGPGSDTIDDVSAGRNAVRGLDIAGHVDVAIPEFSDAWLLLGVIAKEVGRMHDVGRRFRAERLIAPFDGVEGLVGPAAFEPLPARHRRENRITGLQTRANRRRHTVTIGFRIAFHQHLVFESLSERLPGRLTLRRSRRSRAGARRKLSECVRAGGGGERKGEPQRLNSHVTRHGVSPWLKGFLL